MNMTTRTAGAHSRIRDEKEYVSGSCCPYRLGHSDKHTELSEETKTGPPTPKFMATYTCTGENTSLFPAPTEVNIRTSPVCRRGYNKVLDKDNDIA